MFRFGRYYTKSAPGLSRYSNALCVIGLGGEVTFEEWVRYRGLSESSVKKYESAVSGVMSEWAVDGRLMESMGSESLIFGL